MRIAIVNSIPVPLAYGGINRLEEGLLASLGREHQAELVGLPVDERTEDGILRGYYDFRQLDLSAYDAVVSMKSPAFMLDHPVHVSYISHRMRVYYDLYEARDDQHARTRKLIHFMDNWGLSPKRIPHVFTVGETVTRRFIKWGGIETTVLRHPSSFVPGDPTGADYFFAVGRLHAWKRFDLIIRAMRASRSARRLIIAGTGPAEDELRMLAAGDPRIEFAGHVSEDQLRTLYAGAIATLFPPINEDLGLITLESFAARKPVITTRDAGEPAEIIEHGRTGLIADPTPESLAEQIDWIDAHPAETIAMGDACAAFAATITWNNVAATLLDAVEKTRERGLRGRSSVHIKRGAGEGAEGPIRLLVCDNQIIDPPVGGGRIRIWELYRHLPADFTTTYLGAHDHPGPLFRDQQLAPNFREIVVPLTILHFKLHEIWRRLTKGDATVDVTLPLLLPRASPRYGRLLSELLPEADLLFTSHPWIAPLFPADPGLPMIYDSHNCEAALKRTLLGRTFAGRHLAGRVEATERLAVERAALTLACSAEDAAQFSERFGATADRLQLVPNGVDCSRIRPGVPSEKTLQRRRLGLSDAPLGVFIGSAYGPNLAAADFLIRTLAPALPMLQVSIIGGVGEQWRREHPNQTPPTNVRLHGFVEADELLDLLQTADLALNPMTQGSGTNIKMLDYMAAGLAIVTTPQGARGLTGVPGTDWLQAPLTDFIATTRQALAADRAPFGRHSRKIAEEHYDWRAIAAALAVRLRALHAAHRSARGNAP